MIIAAAAFVPFDFEIDDEKFIQSMTVFVIFIAGMVVYLILHEAVHGILMRVFGSSKPFYGFTGIYAYAGSKDYFFKRSYIVISLAPVVILGGVLVLLNILVDPRWFWGVYLIQMINVSGAAGDFYVTWKFCRMPSDILVRDSGVSMVVYSAAGNRRE